MFPALFRMARLLGTHSSTDGTSCRFPKRNGRVSPEQKALIIDTLKAHGRTVGVTGDGVNDILALREAVWFVLSRLSITSAMLISLIIC